MIKHIHLNYTFTYSLYFSSPPFSTFSIMAGSSSSSDDSGTDTKSKRGSGRNAKRFPDTKVMTALMKRVDTEHWVTMLSMDAAANHPHVSALLGGPDFQQPRAEMLPLPKE